jgi:Ca-activated chloride channel family protein
VHPVRIVGREGRINENRVLIQMNQLYAGQEKFVLIEVEITPQKAETERALLQARLQYATSKATEQVVIQTKPLTTRFSDSPEAVLASGNPRVQRDFNYANLAAAKDQAIEYYELGEPEEAFKVLLLNAVEANAWAAENDDAALAKEANELNKGNLYLQQEGLDNTLRKNWRIQSFQTRGGQKAVAQSPGQFDQNIQQINDEESQQTLEQSDTVNFLKVDSQKQNAQPKSEKQQEGSRYLSPPSKR